MDKHKFKNLKVVYIDDELNGGDADFYGEVMDSYFKDVALYVTSRKTITDIQKGKLLDTDIFFIDYSLQDKIDKGTELGRQISQYCPFAALIMLSGDSQFSTVREAMRCSFDDYLLKEEYSMYNDEPDIAEKLIHKHFDEILRLPSVISKMKAKEEIERRKYAEKIILKKDEELENLRKLISGSSQNTRIKESSDYRIIGESIQIQIIKDFIKKYGESNDAVLITGESGTGKELVAQAIHKNSRYRSQKNLVIVNCAAIPDNLIESELFGHKKGSYTGATDDRIGKFEEANGGTLFLDEIGDLSLPAQTKLLRAIQEGIIIRVGENKERKVDVRLVCATNKDLLKLIEEKKFREDLYYRISGFFPAIPPLRERKDDIPLIIKHFIDITPEWNVQSISSLLTTEALSVIKSELWYGNVRELRRFISQTITLFWNKESLSASKIQSIISLWKKAHPDNIEDIKSVLIESNNHIDDDLIASQKLKLDQVQSAYELLNNDNWLAEIDVKSRLFNCILTEFKIRVEKAHNLKKEKDGRVTKEVLALIFDFTQQSFNTWFPNDVTSPAYIATKKLLVDNPNEWILARTKLSTLKKYVS